MSFGALMSVRSVGNSVAAVLVVEACVTFLSARPCACPSEAAAAVGSLRAINSAQQVYARACGSGGFATDLADLAAPQSPGEMGFISPDLDHNGVVKGNYRVTLGEDAAPRFPRVESEDHDVFRLNASYRRFLFRERDTGRRSGRQAVLCDRRSRSDLSIVATPHESHHARR